MALSIGISKHELLNDYYIDEIFDIFTYSFAHGKNETEDVGIDDFF